MAAGANDYFIKVGSPGTATTLSSPGYTSGVSTSINVGSTTNWPSDTGIIFAIDEVTTVDGEEVRVDGTYNEFEGVVASATQIDSVDYVGGDAERSYSAGASTRVYIPVSAERENRLATGMLVDHSQTGGHEVAINYDPSNPTLETQKWAGVASAVNEITVTNAATGNNPKLSATGGDTNIGLNYQTKGTGIHQLLDGSGNEVLKTAAGTASAVNEVEVTNAATGNAPQIAATGGDTNIPLKLSGKGTGAVQMFVNSVDQMGADLAWVPTFTGFSVAPTITHARYILQGKNCTIWLRALGGTSNGTSLTFELPFSVSANITTGNSFPIVTQDNGTIGTTPGRADIIASDATVTCYGNYAAGGWTGSGTKGLVCSFTFPTV